MDHATQKLAEELSELFRENVSVGAVTHQEIDGAAVSIATMSYQTSGEHRRHYEQTAVVLQDEQLDVPEFTLQPNAGGVISGFLNRMVGISNIHFSEPAGFSDQYSLFGWVEDAVRALFNKPVREFFAENPDWSVRGKGHRLVLFHRDRVITGPDLDQFVQSGLHVLTLLQEAEEALDDRPDIRREIVAEDISRAATQMGGIAGMLLGNQLRKIAVTRRELETFLTSHPPRQVPPGMARQVIGENLPLVIVGVLFFIGGIVGGTLWLVLAEGLFKLMGIPFLLIFPAAGFLMAFLTLRFRRRKNRTLRDGKVVTGRVEDVKKTSVTVNNQMRFHVIVSYEINGQQLESKINTYGTAVDQARALKDSGQPARLMIDPLDANHAICVDTLIIFGDE